MNWIILIIDICLLLFLIYMFILREFMFGRKEFKCLRCGSCCKLEVKLYPEDIKKLENACYKDFLHKKNYLKKINGNCIFLSLKNGICNCDVDEIKPKICRNFPKKKFNRADCRCRFFSKFY